MAEKKTSRALTPAELFHQGNNFRTYEYLGSHPAKRGRGAGIQFRVWAPRAVSVSVVGDFNDWNSDENPMETTAAGYGAAMCPNSSNLTIINTALKPGTAARF